MCSLVFLKAFMLIMGVVLFLCGGAVLGVGIWAVAEKIYITDIIGNSLYQSSSYLMVVCGVFIILTSLVGCLGAVSNQKLIVAIYSIILFIIFILLMTAGIVAAVFQDKIETKMRQSMSSTLVQQYGYQTDYLDENQRVTQAWDLVQTKLKCCAVDDRGWGLYQNSRWFLQSFTATGTRVFVPRSCCVYEGSLNQYLNQYNCQSFVYGPPAIWGGADNNALHYMGCYTAVKEFVMDQSSIIVGIGFSFCVFLISAIVISVLFFRKLKGGGSANMHR